MVTKNDEVKVRAKNFVDELGLSVTAFCRNANIGRTTYYGWQSGEFVLSDKTLNRIDQYLSKYHF
ncbi:MAG: hypothetical protein LUE21_04970 [Oscillospiraceae bacterium]|nr:hypothetical protein [Oscillospiraceae bacterium]